MTLNDVSFESRPRPPKEALAPPHAPLISSLSSLSIMSAPSEAGIVWLNALPLAKLPDTMTDTGPPVSEEGNAVELAIKNTIDIDSFDEVETASKYHLLFNQFSV